MNEKPYRVLARKYRPQNFSDLIGQEPMIRTLKNAFQINRIAQAWMLTGVRGVGKTTTARILARALNYKSSTIDKAYIDLSQYGEHCQAIIEGRHMDVVEMDAASHTGIDDIREIIEQIHYKPLTARYKIYIIDEVHMLSNQAFNGLLKTLEEPPEHVKFIFATTEIHKVPITILSRCQRFDLRRIEVNILARHLQMIVKQEDIPFEPQALTMIARAATGSVRDALSLLDQAIAHSNGHINVQDLQTMLGMGDQDSLIELFAFIMQGQTENALDNFALHYKNGADPNQILLSLADINHRVMKQHFVETQQDASLTSEQCKRINQFAKELSITTLSRSWKMLLNAIEEQKQAFMPFENAEMAIIRLCHAAHFPQLDQAQKALFHLIEANNVTDAAPTKISNDIEKHITTKPKVEEKAVPKAASLILEKESAAEGPYPTFEDLIIFIREKEENKSYLSHFLENDIGVINYRSGFISYIKLQDSIYKEARLQTDLTRLTQISWTIEPIQDDLNQNIPKSYKNLQKEKYKKKALENPLVKEIFEVFQGNAELIMPTQNTRTKS